MIDRYGKELKNFPVKLKSSATNSIAVFDYDNNVVRTTVDQDEEFVERIIDQLSDRVQEKEYDLD